MISIIAAIADNGAIGRNNQLLWHIPEDLKYFKRTTAGHTVIMGRKTWESIGRLLTNRRNIVISRRGVQIEGAEIYGSLEAGIVAATESPDGLVNHTNTSTQIFIVGGGEIYSHALSIVDRLYLTLVHTTFEDADTFFPHIDYSKWKEISRESFLRGEKFEYPFEFVVLERILNR